MDPKEFLTTADRLIRGQPSEGDLRSAMSRSYYSCYHAIRIELKRQFTLALLQQSGLGGKIIDHSKLCMALKACKTTYDLGIDLDNLKRLRHLADYDLSTVVTPTDATKTVDDARDFHQDLDAAGGTAAVVRMLHADLQSVHGNI